VGRNRQFWFQFQKNLTKTWTFGTMVLELERSKVKCGMGQKSNDQYDLNIESKPDQGVDSKWEENWNLTSNSNSLFRVKVRSSIGFSILVLVSPHFHMLFYFFKQANESNNFFFSNVQAQRKEV
jgi:hypothetical protein